MIDSTIERKVLWGFGLALLFVLGLTLLAYSGMQSAWQAMQATKNTQHVLLQIATLRSQINASEANQRAYLISRQPQLLRERNNALANIRHIAAELKALTVADTAQQGRLAQLDRALDERTALLDDNIELVRSKGLAALALFLDEGGTQRLLEREERILVALGNKESRQLAALEAEVRQSTTCLLYTSDAADE